VCDAMTSKTYT